MSHSPSGMSLSHHGSTMAAVPQVCPCPSMGHLPPWSLRHVQACRFVDFSKLVPTCRHDILPVASQHWAACKQAATHFKCESHRQFGEDRLATVQCNMVSFPQGWGPSSLGFFSQSLYCWWSIPTDRSLPPPIFFFCLFVFLSLCSQCWSFRTSKLWSWPWAAQVGCDFCTGISGDSYIQLISIPTEALSWSAPRNCSSHQLCYFGSHACFFHISVSLLHQWKVLTHVLKYFPLLNQSLCTCMQTH